MVCVVSALVLPEVVNIADVYIVRAVQDAWELTCTIIAQA